jgi:hypothetical protein
MIPPEDRTALEAYMQTGGFSQFGASLHEPARSWCLSCPVCGTEYDPLDSEPEYLRVRRHLHETEQRLKASIMAIMAIEQAKHWLRAGAPGRALETLEAVK